MTSCFYCIRQCLQGHAGHARNPPRLLPTVVLDTKNMGNEVVIVKNGHRICGGGAALANVPIVQNKAYFELKLQQSGLWGVGLATQKVDLNKVPLGNDTESWVLTSDGTLKHNNEEKGKIPEIPQEGDIIGITYDHVELNFFLNGKPLHCPLTGAKGTLYPAVYVEDGAILDVYFEVFTQQVPIGFDKIMIEQSLL
ncbi:SPRY domain-containing protein 7 [Chamberlinius hualienensis]